MKGEQETVEIGEAEGLSVSSNGLSLCVYVYDEPIWIPLSQISEKSEVKGPGQFGTLVVTKWMAKRLKLIK